MTRKTRAKKRRRAFWVWEKKKKAKRKRKKAPILRSFPFRFCLVLCNSLINLYSIQLELLPLDQGKVVKLLIPVRLSRCKIFSELFDSDGQETMETTYGQVACFSVNLILINDNCAASRTAPFPFKDYRKHSPHLRVLCSCCACCGNLDAEN